MTRLNRDLIPAPTGMDASTDPEQLPEGRCQLLINWLADRVGFLRGQAQFTNLLFTGIPNNLGIGFLHSQDVYYLPNQTGSANSPNPSRIVLAAGSGFSTAPLITPLTWPPAFDASRWTFAGSTTFLVPGKRVRFAQFGSELYAVQDGNNYSNYRIQGTGFFSQMGIPQPQRPHVTAQPPTNGLPSRKSAGIVKYVVTYVDNLGRESSPSNPFVVDYTDLFTRTAGLPAADLYAGPTTPDGTLSVNDVILTFTGLSVSNANQYLAGANVYATLANGSVYYRLNSQPIPPRTDGTEATFEDNLPDSLVAGGVPAPSFGENDPPQPASLIHVHGNRVYLNSTQNPGVLQVSNFNSATQFASVTNLPTDGGSIVVSSDQGNPITGLVSLGGALGVFLRRGLYFLSGEDFTDFDLQFIHDRGCIAPDSVQRCDNKVVWLSDDGVYQAEYIWRLELKKLSKPIEPYLTQVFNQKPGCRSSLESALSAFVDNAYWLMIDSYIFRYDFDLESWSILQLPAPAVNPPVPTTGAGTPACPEPSTSGLVIPSCSDLITVRGLPFTIVVARNDQMMISALDIWSAKQTMTGLVYRTRLIHNDPTDEVGRGQGPRSLRKRIRRIKLFGEGVLAGVSGGPGPGMVTVNCDGRAPAPSFRAVGGNPALGLLVDIEVTPDCYGRAIDITFNLNGTGLVVRDCEVQYISIG